MTNKINSEQAVEHAWKYFELHSNQRITMFNYYLFIMAGLGTAIGVILQTSKNFAYVGIFLSILSIVVSIIFWKLDQRTSFLIKQSESVFKKLERNSAIDIGIFCNEEANLERDNKDKLFFNKIITYVFIFRTIFFITGMIGCLGVIIFLSIITGHMSLK